MHSKGNMYSLLLKRAWTPSDRTEIVCKKNVFGLISIHQVRCTKGPIPDVDGSTDELFIRSL